MSTITAILEADADGSLHLPVPAELRKGKVKVVALLTAHLAEEPTGGGTSKARDWARTARGSVRLESGETVDDVRLAYHAGKHGVQR